MNTTLLALAFGALLPCLALSQPAEAKDWSKIRIASEGAYAPWNGMDPSGKLIGFEIDLAQTLCKRMQADCEIVAQDWDGMIPALQQGKYDAIMAAMSITDERKAVMDFAGPYGTEPSAFSVLADSPLGQVAFASKRVNLSAPDAAGEVALAELVKALKGKSIGVQTSTIQANFVDKYLPDVSVRTYDKLDSASIDLLAGRVDAILGDRSVIEALGASQGGKMVQFGPDFVRGVLGDGFGIGLRKADADLKAKFNDALAAATADGTLSKLSLQHFGYDVSVK